MNQSAHKVLLGERGAAALAVGLSCGAAFLLMWLWWDMTGGDEPFHWSWRVPLIATLLSAVIAYLLPHKMIARLAGSSGGET